jgi:ATP-dependent helicase/nuclease subunit A
MTGRGAGVPPVWASGSQDCAATVRVRAELGARSRQEHNRLLYVAMTRAADRLVVAPFRGKIKETEAAWCRMIRTGLETALGSGETIETAYGPAILWRDGQAARGSIAPPRSEPEPPSEPAWLRKPVAPEEAAVAPLHPSGMLDAADGARLPPPRLADAGARRRGLLVHALLQHLPRVEPAARSRAGLAYLRSRAPGLGEPALRGILAAVMRLVEDPALAPLFSEHALAEVNLSGRVSVGGVERPVTGRVDRLAVGDDTVTLADFKTGRPPAEDAPLPEAEAAQLALYARLVARIYPGRRVVPMLVWTSGAIIRTLDEAAVEAALARAGIAG